MSKELTMAAQQALACMRGLQQHLGPDICAIEADALERAITTSQPAQAGEVDERCAGCGMTASYETVHACKTPSRCGTTLNTTQPAAQATPEPVKFSHAGHFYNLVAHALMEVKRPDACAHRLRLILDELAVLMGQPATPPQQAAGEPWGWVVNSTLFRGEFAEDDAKAEAKRCGGTSRAVELFTHPAPGVPEGAREALERIASWNEHPAMLGVDYGSNGVRDYYRKIASDALAAAQAKGADK